MASRDNFPKKYVENIEESSKRQHQRGYSRRTYGYSRHNHNGRNLSYQNNYKTNESCYYFKRNDNNNKNVNGKANEDDHLCWRKPKNKESIISQRESLVTQITERQYECSICFAHIVDEAPIWSCDYCYNIFHFDCIKKWSKTCGEDNENTSLNCPFCRKQYSLATRCFIYQCYCGKMKNPVYNWSIIPHSCGDPCGKRNKVSVRCPHVCSLLCHPGPCPMCEASVKSNCHCGKVEFVVKCSASDSHLSCGSKCEKRLNCCVHVCQELCHPGSCNECVELVMKTCHCGGVTKEVVCGSVDSDDASFTCGDVCPMTKDCGLHKCGRQCHPGPCDSCTRSPQNTTTCPCGKASLTTITDVQRERCTDPIATCGEVCDREYAFCEHKCSAKCHEGDCRPCPLTSNVKCRCGKTSQNIRCADIARTMLAGGAVTCTTRCKVKKQCGSHRCQELCCDVQVHLCTLQCGKLLTCKAHGCDRPCHKGKCPDCDRVTFEELTCRCGRTNMLPPIACGQEAPPCPFPCTREHDCDHEVAHSCHSEPRCPVCTVLTSKPCPGLHKTLYNVPCFRPVVTCGLMCGRPLPDCEHLCAQTCHEGPCSDAAFVCTQLCTRPRPECGHPCNESCHPLEECTRAVSPPCQSLVELHCSCHTKMVEVTCERVHRVTVLLTSDLASSNRREAAEFIVANNGLCLVCDPDCKKAAKAKQLSEAFELDSFTFDRISYSSFLRDFSVKYPDFLMRVDTILCGLIRTLDAEKKTKSVYKFDPMNREKKRFIQELSEHFFLSATLLGSDTKHSISVEAVKGICKIPSNRLLHFIQKNYPQLFRTEKPKPLRNVKLHSSINEFPYAVRMKSINEMNKS